MSSTNDETKVELDNDTKTNDTTIVNDKDVDIESLSPDEELVLTTFDNPYNPKTDYAKWQTWDNDNGYNTEEFIARLISMEESFDINDEVSLTLLTNKVIQEILDNDVINSYVLV